MNPPRLATAKAAVDMKGPEVIPSDDDDKPVEEATTTKPRRVGRTTPGGKTGLVSRTASGKAAKLRVRAATDETREVAVAGMPAGVPLTMDNDNEYVVNATAAGMVRPRLMAVATARGAATATGGSAPTGE